MQLRFRQKRQRMLAEVIDLALRSWQIVGLSGYGRADVRIDSEVLPWVLEVHANSYLFAQRLCRGIGRTGIGFSQAIVWILNACL